MAKAGGNTTTTTWILLFEARALAIEAYDGAVQLAERLLREWLGDGRVRWSCKLFEAARVSELAAINKRESELVFLAIADVAYSDGDPAFWRIGLEINWEESWAREMYAGGSGNRAYGIRVVREDVLAQLPGEPSECAEAAALPRQHQTETRSSKSLITAEVERRLAAGERYDNITPLSESLHEWMKTVSARPLEPRSIENLLRKLKLWPLPPKK